MKVGIGYDSHPLVRGRKLILGGVEIPFEQGLLGHSDADVLIHAIGDAILGALGRGDMGELFPDDDVKNRDASSLTFLKKIGEIVDEEGYVVSNIDATVLLEKPKLRDYKKKMAENIAQVLSLSPCLVSIKAKTNERMGFIGRGEGVAALAVVSLKVMDVGGKNQSPVCPLAHR